MSLSYFNVTSDIIPRPRDPLLFDQNGDGFSPPTALTQYIINATQGSNGNSSAVGPITTKGCNIFPLDEHAKYAHLLVPCTFFGTTDGNPPLDHIPYEYQNPARYTPTGVFVMLVSGLSFTAVGCSGAALVYFRNHAALALTPWPVLAALHLFALVGSTLVLLDVGFPTATTCIARSVLASIMNGGLLLTLFVRARSIAKAIELQHRISAGSPSSRSHHDRQAAINSGSALHQPQPLQAKSAAATTGIRSHERIHSRTTSFSVVKSAAALKSIGFSLGGIGARSRSTLSLDVSTAAIVPATPEQQLLFRYALVDGSRGARAVFWDMVQSGIPFAIVYMSAIVLNVSVCQPIPVMSHLSGQAADLACACKVGNSLVTYLAVFFTHVALFVATGLCAYKHRKAQFNNRVMARIGMSLINLAIFMVLMLAFSTMPGQGWVYSTMAFLRAYSCLSTVSIITIPIFVHIYNARGGSAQPVAPSRVGSADSLTECVQHLRLSSGRNAPSRVLPAPPAANAGQQQQVGSATGSSTGVGGGVTAGEAGAAVAKHATTKPATGTTRHQQSPPQPEILQTRSMPPVSPHHQPFVDDTTAYLTSSVGAADPTKSATNIANKSEPWRGDGGGAESMMLGSGDDDSIHDDDMPVTVGVRAFAIKSSRALPPATTLQLNAHDPVLAEYRARSAAVELPGASAVAPATPAVANAGGGRGGRGDVGRSPSTKSRRKHGRRTLYDWKHVTVLVMGGPVRSDMKLVFIPENSQAVDADRLAGPPTSFELIPVEDRGQGGAPAAALLTVRLAARPTTTTLTAVLHCVTKKRFLALQFASHAQYQDFMALVPPRTALEVEPLMSVI
ncbi:hypothetical protein BC828DRAFT_417803 [Blastocladiella britannica]|nr:hypothetical protein BC828DRAFT_417803 [Blastocladiella britannica]